MKTKELLLHTVRDSRDPRPCENNFTKIQEFWDNIKYTGFAAGGKKKNTDHTEPATSVSEEDEQKKAEEASKEKTRLALLASQEKERRSADSAAAAVKEIAAALDSSKTGKPMEVEVTEVISKEKQAILDELNAKRKVVQDRNRAAQRIRDRREAVIEKLGRRGCFNVLTRKGNEIELDPHSPRMRQR